MAHRGIEPGTLVATATRSILYVAPVVVALAASVPIARADADPPADASDASLAEITVTA